jgi:hypothetical protein
VLFAFCRNAEDCWKAFWRLQQIPCRPMPRN